MEKKYRRMLCLLAFILVVSSTIAYSALTSSLQLNAEAKLRTVSDIRVTDIKYSSTSGGTLQYESTYDVNTITSGFVLPTTESSITYKVQVTNNGTIDQTIYDILTQSSNNNGLYYEISGYNVRDVIGFRSVIEFYITYKTTTPSNDVINVVNRFNFKKVYHLTFETNGGTTIPEGNKYEGVDLSLSSFTSTKTGYTLAGWTDEQDGTTVKYQTNGTYTLDQNKILYAIWAPSNNTAYTVNHYVHDLGTNTYTLNSTDNLTGTTDSTVTLANLKKTIAGFTYVDGYLTGGTTKPTSGAVTTTTILADGSRVINLYYRRNYLYVQYHVNGGQLAEQHGIYFGVTNSLVTSTGNTTPNKFWVGVYGSKVNAVTNANTYAQGTAGLDNYNNPNYLNLEKTGYTGKSGQEWNTNASETGTSYSQATTTYDANNFGGADLSTGDKTVTLYVNWVPVNYEIQYDLQGGNIGEQCAIEGGTCTFEGTKEVCFGAEGSYICKTATNLINCNRTVFEGDPLGGVNKACYISNTNPSSYNIESSNIILNNPLKTGYTFTGWTGSNGETPSTSVTIPTGSTGAKGYVANYTANTTTLYLDPNGGTYNNTTSPTAKTMTFGTKNNNDVGIATRNGYTFNGWGNAANYLYFDNTGKNVATTNPTHWTAAYPNGTWRYTAASTLTMYANWTPMDYEITYDLQGGSLATSNPASYNIETATFTLNSPTLDGYTFLGWTGSNGNTPQTTVTIPVGSTGAKAYIANWQANTYDVTFDTNGGTIGANELFSFDGSTHTIDGTIVGATWGIDYLQFAGNSSSYVRLGQINSDYMTLQATFSIDEPADGIKVIIGNVEQGGGCIVLQQNNGQYVIMGEFYINGAYRTIYSNITPEVGKKYNVLLSYDGETERLFIDNVLIGEINVTGTIKSPENNTIMALGGNPNGSAVTQHFFKGKIYNASIYSNPKKHVTYDSPYGTLPTPTRDGYIFRGWNGKNILNIPDKNISFTNYWYSQESSNPKYIFKPSTDYTLTFDYDINLTDTYLASVGYGNTTYSKDIKPLGYSNNTSGKMVLRFTTPATFDYDPPYAWFRFVRRSSSGDADVDISNIQLEEGSNETPYEPYYVTSSTNVTQTKNHTLKAIWDLKESTFLQGLQFNAKIKQLAGNQDATYETENTNITSIVRSNSLNIMPTDDNVVSTSDSNTPIYAWFDNNSGTLYYYTDAVNIYMNSSASYMFYNLRNATSIDLDDINTTKTTSMYGLFHSCINLSNLDLSNFDTSDVRSARAMFAYDSSLSSLDLSSFDLGKVYDTTFIFEGMTSLKTLKTPSVYPTDSSLKLTLPKLMIDVSCNEYTELDSSSPTETMLYRPATLLSGGEFNVKIKQLANPSLDNITTTTADTNITSIERTNTLSITPTSSNIISTPDSYYPIYAWFDNGTIYYYSESTDVYFNPLVTSMFRELRNVESIDIENINSNQISGSMWAMFLDCYKLESLDLSNFNTINVTSMHSTFQGCTSLQTLDLSNFETPNLIYTKQMFLNCTSLKNIAFGNNFDTSKVTDMYRMFYNTTSLTSLDLSGFDMSSATDTTEMLANMSSLHQVKTPDTYPSEAVIQLPKTLYQANGNAWTILDSSAPTETWLKLEYIPYTISYNLDGGAVATANPTSYNINSSAITLNNPTRSGYAFAGWSGGKNIQTIPTIYVTVTEARNTTIDQMFFIKAGTYTYTRNVDGVSSLRDAIILKDLNGNDLSDSSYSPNNLYYYNTSYQAWIIGTDSTGSTLSRTITIKEDCYIKFVVMFGGSSNTKIISQLEEGTTSTYVDKQTTVTIPTSSTGNRVYTANWTANNYTVTAEANGGSIPSTTGWTGTGNSATKTVTYDSEYGTLPTPTRTGYTFSGWTSELQSDLPSNYRKLDYIESTRTQYIDTGYIPKTNTKIELDLSFNGEFSSTNLINGDNNSFLGVNDSPDRSFSINFGAGNVGRQEYYILPWFNIIYQYQGQEAEGFNTNSSIIANRNTLTIENGKIQYGTKGRIISSKQLDQLNSMYIFGSNNETIDSYGCGPFTSYNMRVYDMKIYENNVLVRHYVPVVNATNHKLGLYETENDTFHSSGTLSEFESLYITSNTTVNSDYNHVLTAIWNSIEYEITYDLQGGTLATSNPATYNIESNTITLNNPTMTGYTFLGWTGSNGNVPETTVTIPTGSTGAKAYVANWQANTYTVTADANGGTIPSTTGWTGTGNSATKSVTYNSQYGTLPTPTRNGYTFNGWTYGVNFTGVSGPMWVTGIADSSLVSTILKPNTTYKIEYDVTLNEAIPEGYTAAYTGQWGNIGFRNGTSSYTYQIANGGSLYSKSGSNYEVGRKYHLLATITTPSDLSSSTLIVYTAQAKNSNNYLYNIFGTFSNIVFYESTDDYGVVNSETINKVADDHTITANWNLNRYKITYDLQGGSLADSNPTTYFVYTPTFTLNNPTLTGYTFLGWTGSNGNTPQTTVTIPAGSTGDKAYIANWQANTYDVTFDTNGGTIGTNELFSFDGSNHTIDGTIVGATWGTDYLQFAGNSSSYVRLGQINSDYMTLQTTFSVDEMPTETEVIMGNIESGGSAIFIAKSPTTNNMNIAGYSFISGSYRRIDSEIVPEVGKKYNVLLSYDGETERLYIDDVLIDEIKISGVITPPASNTVMALGGNPSGSAVNMSYFKGKIYNASIYSNPKKQVTYDSPYGTLPTPTRDNYIFRGWNSNGKNLFNMSKWLELCNSVSNGTITKGSNSITLTATSDNHGAYTITYYVTRVSYGDLNSYKLNVKPNTTYTLSWKTDSDKQGRVYVFVNDRDNNDGANNMFGSNSTSHKLTFTTPSDAEFIRMRVDVNNTGDSITYSDFQLEEGTTVTSYEPYYVTSSTTVTQANDHTLTAVWDLKESTFLSGIEFNAKIKQIAGNQDATYSTDDTNITSIVRSNSLTIMPTDDNVVSTSNSNTPIYAWFDSNSGTLYYYTDAVNLYMNANAYVMFYNLKGLTTIDLSNINTSKTTVMQSMFNSDRNLRSINVSNFDTSNVINMQAMFISCSSLNSLDISSFDMSKVTNTSNMFAGMTSLKSLKTPSAYPTNSSVKLTLPKLMVDANGNEYTELDNTSPTNTMLYIPATFLPGQQFIVKIKQLANPSLSDVTMYTGDTNITSIVRTNTLSITPTSANVVSTDDSYIPIYAWFDNGTIYYYSEASNLYMNENSSSMFYNIRNIESIDVSALNTKKVTNLNSFFANSISLTNVTLGSNFNTSNVTDMRYMFYHTDIETLDISSFDMTNVTNTAEMFRYSSNITSLKTPKTYPSEAVMELARTLYDSSGNSWSVLNSSSPPETWLHKMVCKRATTLHTETCSQTDSSLYCSGAGYTVGGSKNTSTITYGSLGTNATTLNSGDAFTCDVNGDGTFNETTERFYYVGDYYNTTTKQFETDTGVLIYYNNVSGGAPSNTATSVYDSSGENWHGPVNAILRLPTTSQWSNVELKNNTRAILTYNTTNLTAGGTLPSDFSYSGYSARLLTAQEINHSLNRTLSDVCYRLDDVAPYLFENTQYSSPNLKIGWWLETTDHNSASALRMMIGYESYYVNGIYPAPVSNSSGMGVRPAIEVNKNFLNKKVNAYLITYDTNGGSENSTQTVTEGDSLGSLSVPTREGYTFAGWYTEASGGTQITTATVPTATTTYYAHWTPIDYNITYDLDGGTVATNNPSTYNADSNSITLNNSTKTGYTFAGWSGGNNLFNKDATPYYQNSWINESGNRYNEQYYSVYKIPIDENKEYTITHTHTVVNPCYAIFDENDTLLSVEKYSSRKTITFTSPANSKYILVSVITDPTFTPHYDKDIFQLEEGSTATSYEPYVSNETTLTIPSGSVGNRKYIANWTANTYTVTADANGGSIPSTTGWTGTGNTATKSVTYDSQYGTLPTPTRNGYTFKGWNGKNLFDYQNNSYYTAATIKEVINGESAYKLKTNYLSNNIWPVFRTDETEMEEDSIYTMSLDIWADSATSFYSQRFFINNATSINPHNLDTIETNKQKLYATYTYKTSSMQILHIYPSASNNPTNEIYISNVQIEEGSTATAYEPYYVISSTNVTQDKNHTLKAIWEMDTYQITYDLQGGTLANSNPATYNVETNTFTLNNPTLTGQTFIGWTGSNGNTPEVNVTIPVGSYGDKAYVANFSPIYEPETRIRSLNTIGTSIADDDPDSNLRYIGSNPNNYVSFNGQKWRIIGVFNGKLKIIQDSIGNYSFDTSRNTVNNGNGINQWGANNNGHTGADLMKLLNPGYSSNTDLKCNNTYSDGNCGTNDDSDYTSDLVNNSLWWNAESGYCYNNANYKTKTCDFTTTGLQSDTARNMIDNATWYLGTHPSSDSIWDGRMTASYLYNMERSNNNGSTTWQGKVGLIYPSDYVYATGGGTTHNRNTCLTVHSGYVDSNSNIQNWDNTYTDCKNNDWLFISNWIHTISPRNTAAPARVFSVYTSGFITDYYASHSENVLPVVYLKSSIKFTTGDGSFNSPFNLIDTE